MPRNLYYLSSFLIFLLSSYPFSTAYTATSWQMLAPGLMYTELKPELDNSWGSIHAFKINLALYQLNLSFAQDYAEQTTTVRHLVSANNALIGVNGGFFTPGLQPIGLRINAGQLKKPLQQTSWWGIFYIAGEHARIVPPNGYHTPQAIDFAVQGGPRLVVNGNIPKLKPGFAERTALGITSQGEVIVLVTHHAPLTTLSLAKIMQRPPSENGLACYNALNLDGGSSSQLYAKIGKFELYIPGLNSITDAVLVSQRDA